MNLAPHQALIICGGEKSPRALAALRVDPPSLIIAADRGADYALEAGLTPSIIIGDLDSISRDTIKHAESSGIEIIRHHTDKDSTDLELALDYALSKKISEITLTCSLGKRIDYTLGNLLVLTQKKFSPFPCSIVEDGSKGILLRDDSSTIMHGEQGDTLSLVPLSVSVTGVNLKGVQWELSGETIHFGSSRTLSNRFVERSIQASIEAGTCLMLHIEKAYA